MKKFTILRFIITWYRKLAILLGIIIPIICYLEIPNISILNDPLSRFGIEEDTKYIWILFNQLMALALLSIGKDSNSVILNPLYKKTLDWLLYPSLICFSLSGFITMDIKYLHLTLAGLFFLLYIGYIFWYGIFIKNKSLTILSLILVTLCVIGLFPTLIFPISYGTFEVVFIASIIIWNIFMIKCHEIKLSISK